MYTLTHYHLVKITPFSDLSRKDRTAVEMAITAAEKSRFLSNHRLGACLEKGQCLLCG